MTELVKAQADISGLMQVLGRNLYSSPLVSIRESVQNAHDSIERRRIEAPERPFEARIDVSFDPGARSITITDTGSGLTYGEIKEFLATIGQGYTRQLRTANDLGNLMGQFGLGFLSTYMVSRKVEFATCSYQSPDEAWLFVSRGGETYTVSKAPAQSVGSRLTLHVKDDFDYLCDDYELQRVLYHYCRFLPVPILVDGEQVNHTELPWRVGEAASALRNQKAALDFVRDYDGYFDPLCCMDFSFDEHTHGLFWIHDSTTYGNEDNRWIEIYLRGMLLTNENKDLLPRWAGFVSGILLSTRLVPTASREALVHDELLEGLRDALYKALITYITGVSKEDPVLWRRILLRHAQALTGAAISDQDLFNAIRDDIRIPTSLGDATVPELLSQSGGELLVSMSDEGGFEELLCNAQGLNYAKGFRYGVLGFLKQYARSAGVELSVLGTQSTNEKVFRKETMDPDTLRGLKRFLNIGSEEELVPCRFEPAYLPIVIVPNQDVLMKKRLESDEADKRISQATLHLARMVAASIEVAASVTIYVNLNSSLIDRLLSASEESSVRVGTLIRLFSDNTMRNTEAGIGADTEQSYRSFFEGLLELLEN